MKLKNNKLALGLSCSLLFAGVPVHAGVGPGMFNDLWEGVVILGGLALAGGIAIGYGISQSLTSTQPTGNQSQRTLFVMPSEGSFLFNDNPSQDPRGATPKTLAVLCNRCNLYTAELSGKRLQEAVHGAIQLSEGKIIQHCPFTTKLAVYKILHPDVAIRGAFANAQ